MKHLINSSLVALLSTIASAQNVLHTKTTPGGFNRAARGWNSWGMQVTIPGFQLNQSSVQPQCDAVNKLLGNYGYNYCSLDSGWSVGDHGDEYGRIIYDPNAFNLPQLAKHLHNQGMRQGIYMVAGFFSVDINRTIYGTNPPITLSEISDGNCGYFARCQIDYTKPGAQDYCNSNIDLFASWGVDFIKFDFITPGSPNSNVPLDPDTSPAVICYHNAIKRNGRQIRLDISWKLNRTDPWYDVWKHNADSFRTDEDDNNYGGSNFTIWRVLQRAIENYRQYILLEQLKPYVPLTIYPDLDNLFVANAAPLSGISDVQRKSMMSHWIGAAANLILGSDMTKVDSWGKYLLTKPEGLAAADFAAKYPMYSVYGTDNPTAGKQGQLWVAGPDPSGCAQLLFSNYGAYGNASLFDPAPVEGPWTFTVTADLLAANGLKEAKYNAVDIWDAGNKQYAFTLPQTIAVSDSDVLYLKLTPA